MQMNLERIKLKIKILSFFSAIIFMAFIYFIKFYTIVRTCEFKVEVKFFIIIIK